MNIAQVVVLFTVTWAVNPAVAQDARVEVATQTPPYYVGESAIIQFTVEGFDEQPQPSCVIDTPSGKLASGLRGQLAATNPSVVSQIIQRNGKVFQSKRVTYQLQYLVSADRAGDFQVGPFLIRQGKKEARVNAVPMSFQSVPLDTGMRVRLILPDNPVYLDQRVPVTVEWWYADDLEKVLKLSIYSQLFDQFRFGQDETPTRGSAQLPIDTEDGRLALAAEVRKEQHNGRTFIVVSATRTLIPDRAGEFPLSPITATLRKAAGWAKSRSMFDDFDDFGFGGSMFRDLMESRRRPTRTVLSSAVGQPQTLIVRPFPAADRPESFAGAVGTGFSLESAADRTVVRVGDPIKLNITLRGDGNIENASLPPLSADSGLNPDSFHLPQGDVTGRYADGVKEFQVTVRVTDESIAEIPALAYSWFDPATETYQTARSKPIALRVMPAQIVSAGDIVVSDDTKTSVNDVVSSETDRDDEVSQGKKHVEFSLSGADLAIEPDASVVLHDTGGALGYLVKAQSVIYAAGLLTIIAAVVDRRRCDVDPAIKARRRIVKQQNARIARAAGLTKREAAGEVAEAIRVLIAEVPDMERNTAHQIVAECESIVYAPEGTNDGRLDTNLIERAKRVATV